MDKRILSQLRLCIQNNRQISFLVGAGLSSESGVPTFRGKDGFWTSGSKNHAPEKIGTRKMFQVASMEVWKWFLYRKSITENATPNEGHRALKNIEDLLGDRFALISQNVDSLHKKEGNSMERTYLIHGDLDYVRCGDDCSDDVYPFPKDISLTHRQKDILTDLEWSRLRCPKCGEDLRPHVLWFDEFYNEKFYKLDTVMKIAWKTDLLFVIGTSGTTNLPQRIVEDVLLGGGLVVYVNLDESHFTHLLKEEPNGIIINDNSSHFLKELEKSIINTIEEV